MTEPVHAPSQPWRFAGTILLFAGLAGLVVWRLHRLQIEEGPRLADQGARQGLVTRELPAVRGGIYDAEGTPLVVSEGAWKVVCDPQYMDDKPTATVALSQLLGIPRDTLKDHFEAKNNGRVIASGVREPEPSPGSAGVDLAEQVAKLRLAGVYLQREFVRSYKEPGVAAHLLGFTQADGSGGGGVELALNTQLTGVSGRETIRLDPHGKPMWTDAKRTAPVPGANVELSIRLPVQRILEEELRAAFEKHAPQGVCGLVVAPATGEILALASLPTFDPSDRNTLTPERQRNHVLGFVYEPGSTVKPLFVGAAVDAGLARMDESIDCEHGAWTHHWGRGRRTVHEKTGGHGVLSMTKVISLSDNIAMAKLGVRLGPERLRAWTDAFGFGGRIGIDLPGEDAGLLPGPKAWNPLDACMSIPMGHAMAVTPLQLAMAHAAIANGGVWLPPKLVRRAWTNSAAGEQPVVLEAGPAPRRLLRAETAAAIQLAMTHTMLEGTAKRSQLQGYSSAGKTGTAEKLINGRYADHLNVGSFVCWAPATPGVRPEALCLVVVDAPTRNGRFGADTAAPVVQRVLQRTLEHLAVPQTEQPVAESGRRRPARGQR